MRLIQHKKEAWWFYRVVSKVYDRWVNPLFWTAPMRDAALELARLGPGLRVLDAGAGTGFTTEGILRHADAERVVMVDQSPHQLAQARRKPALAGVRMQEGDAERLPFAADAFDRYVSAGSIE
jgi:MPBQ/MSBQ methyltransferase